MKTATFDHIDADTAALDVADRGSAKAWFAGWIKSIRDASAARSLRRQLAELDDNLLRDIGIGEDEIYLVRQQKQFMPRAWM
jgi:uncharacterized protein YjiS (DUF1127 family)